jgi:hypothetical protein
MQKAGFERIGFELPNGLSLPPDTNKVDDLAIQFYIALWYKYLKLNPHLIAIASEYDEFADIFKGKFPFCQADIIRQSVQHGIESLKPMCEEFMTLCRQIINRDILTIDKGIIACCEYSKGALLGECISCQVKDSLYVAHLFGQFHYGAKRCYTNYLALKSALIQLETLAQKYQLPVYLPYKLGCGLAGGDWQIVYNLIRKYCPSAIICKLS